MSAASPSVVVGVDEAGVGCCWGSLWAAAVHLPAAAARVPAGLCDSKKMTEKRRERVRAEVLAVARHGMGEVTHEEIDRLGLGEARRLVFERALDDFVHRNGDVPDHVVVDGTLYRPWRGVPYTLEPRADAAHACVSAASVLAKTTRDRQVVALCDAPGGEAYAPYGIRRNKGYLSKEHIEAIGRLGRTPLHRHSYHIRSLLAAAADAAATAKAEAEAERTRPATPPPDAPEGERAPP